MILQQLHAAQHIVHVVHYLYILYIVSVVKYRWKIKDIFYRTAIKRVNIHVPKTVCFFANTVYRVVFTIHGQ